MKSRIFTLGIALLLATTAWGQMNYGMTGLMNMPTADMQRDKTLMGGASFLNHHTSVHNWTYNTFNYYLNITIFPWLEVGYLCQLNKGAEYYYGGHSGYWPEQTWGKFTNQDRSFHVRLRLWKAGWWRSWTPQVVLGANDIVTESWAGGSLSSDTETDSGNGFMNRYYLVVTKHFEFAGVGDLGAHVAWIYRRRQNDKINDPAIGASFRFDLKDNDKLWRKMVNGITLMAECLPGRTEVTEELKADPEEGKYQVNLGLMYSVVKDHINAAFELGDCRYPSVTLQLKLHLK